MKNLKHTKGPWKVHSAGFLMLDDGTAIAIKHASVDNRFANARLIASAPELLKTLKWLSKFNIGEHYLDRIEKTIAKAEGRDE